MKRHSLWILVGSVLLIASCATTGDIGVDLGADRTFHISPANQDGVQDTFSVPASVIPVERSRVQYYRIEITNPIGTTVLLEEGSIEEARFFWQRRRQSVETPQIVIWDGTVDDGSWAPDGGYRVAFEVRDNRDRVGRIDDIVVFVDNRAPYVEASVAFPAFSPNGDGRLDTITVFQRRSSIEERWSGEIRDSGGAAVRSWTWNGAAVDLVWDGTNDSGTTLPSGEYSYQVTSTDLAGNTGTFTVPQIEIDTEPRAIALEVDITSISPNNDGIQDAAIFRIVRDRETTVESTRIEVVDVTGRARRTLSIAPAAQTVPFDGRGDNGRVLPDGTYRGIATVTYTNGDTVTTAGPLIDIDTVAPRVAVSADYSVFSPDNDGNKDVITIRQSSGYELETTGEVVAADRTVVRRFSWTGPIADVEWDGTANDGTVVEDGDYLYRVSSRDTAGNRTVTELVAIRVDTRPTPVEVQVGSDGFSPNGDGLSDTVAFSPISATDAAVDTWTLEVRTHDGTPVYRVAGTRTLPESSIVWDGYRNIATSASASSPRRLAADGLYNAHLMVEFEKGNIATATSRSLSVDTTGPAITLAVPEGLFSPDGDGVRDTLPIDITATDTGRVVRWTAQVRDPVGTEFWTRDGLRTPPRQIVWNGTSQNGELVQSSSRYTLTVTAEDAYGNVGSAEAPIDTDVLVLRRGDELRIVLSSINFAPFTADYINLAPELAAANAETLDRVYDVLTRYPGYNIRIEGHAVSLLWANPARARTEQQDVLIPLSRARAEAIRRALIQRGIDGARVTTRGFGGAFPVVPHSDEANRWKSRRVEFILEER